VYQVHRDKVKVAAVKKSQKPQLVPPLVKNLKGNFVVASIVVDICNKSLGIHHHRQQQQQQPVRGYLHSPSYSHPYRDSADCAINVTAPHRRQRVRLYVVDLQLATDGAGCADWLQIFDGLKSVTLCGRRSRRLLATSARQQLQVRFHGNRQHRSRGLWLYYEGTVRQNCKTKKHVCQVRVHQMWS